MTFEQAMVKSEQFKYEALMSIVLRLPNRKAAMSAYIAFNPYMFLLVAA